MERDKVYRYWLHNLPGIGDKTIKRLLEKFGSAEEIYNAPIKELCQVLTKNAAENLKEFSKTWEPEKQYERIKKQGISFYSPEDEQYPERLRKLTPAPYGIYCKGSMPPEEMPSVAIIGARECSEYGSHMADAFAGKMALAGVAVVSGMARGIDGIGQMAAVRNKGRTYGVLGCGADICYPASNRKLYQDILDTGGGILSGFPPGTPPRKSHFPERNRIVAGLSDVLLVVEARIKSGTFITVDMALEQGKNVYAVPGRLTDRLSDGCNLLIRQGAGIALTPEDILAELKILENRQGAEGVWKGNKKSTSPHSEQKSRKADPDILLFLDFYPKSADEILKEIQKAGWRLALPELLAQLVELCLEGDVKQVSGNYFIKVCQI